MQKKNWLSSAVFLGISASGAILLFASVVSIGAMVVRGEADLLSALVLLALTLAASRFTVSVTSADGISQSRKSVAETFVFLAVMLYAIPPLRQSGARNPACCYRRLPFNSQPRQPAATHPD